MAWSRMAAVFTTLVLTGSGFWDRPGVSPRGSFGVAEAQQIPPPVQQRGGAQPILYLDTEAGGLALRGVYPDGRRVRTPFRSSPTVPELMWSPDGKWFAYAIGHSGTANTSLEVMNLEGDRKTIFTTEGEAMSTPIWSPDGGRIAVMVFGGPPSALWVAVIDVAAKKLQSRYKLPTTIIDPATRPDKFRWSPDGRKILLSRNTAAIIDTVTGGIERVADQRVLPEWAPGSNAVYYFDLKDSVPMLPPSNLGDFYLKTLAPTSVTTVMDRKGIEALGLTGMLTRGFLALSPKGSKLAVSGSSTLAEGGKAKAAGVVYIYDLSERRTVTLDKPSKSFQTEDLIMALDWAPDESGLAAVAVGTKGISIKLLDLTTGAWRILATVANNEYIGSLYLMVPLKTMSWTQ